MTAQAQTTLWQRWWQQCRVGRLPHAFLLVGIPGAGKTAFAAKMTAALLCQSVSSEGEACGQCHDCRLLAGEVHPNLMQVIPEKPGQAIKVDQVREANDFVAQSSLKGKMRVVIFNPADQLNTNAANALLKTLEEPSSDAILILVCHQAGALPATVRSRCQRILFTLPYEDALALQRQPNETREAFYDGLISLSAKRADALALAQTFQKEEVQDVLAFVLSFCADLMKVRMAGSTAKLVHAQRAESFKTLSQQTNLSLLNAFVAQCLLWQKQCALGFQLNKVLLLETLFYRWMECAA